VIGSSLGGRLVPSAMAALHDRDAGRIVDTVSLLGAAVPVEAVGLDGTYGPGLDANAASVDNFWKSDDLALEASFRLAELTGAVGSNGLPDGDEPAGYTDHRVDYVESHQDYWKVDTGCAKALVDAW